jgi:IS6 family transposase
VLWQVEYLNNVVEADHGELKQLIRPVRGSKTLTTTYATIMGFEVMRALRKGQAAIFHLTQDIRGEARIVERAFGIGASALAEAAAPPPGDAPVHLYSLQQSQTVCDVEPCP